MNLKEKMAVANFYAYNFNNMFPHIVDCDALFHVHEDCSATIVLTKGEETSIIECKRKDTKASFEEIKFNQIGL